MGNDDAKFPASQSLTLLEWRRAIKWSLEVCADLFPVESEEVPTQSINFWLALIQPG